jgi:intein/homing endonuclease
MSRSFHTQQISLIAEPWQNNACEEDPPFASIEFIEEVEGQFQVFNFQCAPHDNYFAEFLLVHNCCIQAPFKQGEALMGLKESTNSYRIWSVERVLDELELLATRYGVRNIKIADEMFVLNPKHIEGICKGIIQRGLDFNFWAYARVDTVREGMVEPLKRAGFNWLAFGIEAANDRVRDAVQKGFGQELIFSTLKRVRTAGINVIGNYIFGLPEDDSITMQQTLDLALELNSEFANFYCFPAGTPVYTPHGLTPIDQVLVGQEVFGIGGTTTVVNSLRRYYEGKVLEIKPRLLPAVTATPEHPFLIAELQRNRRNKAELQRIVWKEAKDLVPFDKHDLRRPYDAVVLSKSMFESQDTYVDFSPFVNGQVGGGRLGGPLGETGRRFLEPWTVTEELAELFGGYLAEGCRTSKVNNQVGFALCAEETENINRIRDLVGTCFGYRTRVLPRVGKAVMLTLTSKVLYRALPALIGEDSHSKRVPTFILNASEKITSAFLRGYVAGDGTSYPNTLGQFSLSSCSDTLVREVLWLFLKNGTVPSYAIAKNPPRTIRGRLLEEGKYYRLAWLENLRSARYVEDERNFYVPIKSVTAKPYEGWVYNLKTENETYAVPFIVHNCAMAYPGSPLYQQAVAEGWPLPATWSGYSQHSEDCLPLPTKHLRAGEVLRFRDEAFQTYFRAPRYLEMIGQRFGPETVAHVREMASHPLTRRFAAPRREAAVA